jgi:hypothetical protein
MSKQAWFGLLLLAAGGVAVYAYRDPISEKLGLQQFSPSRAKAIRLAMDANNLDRYESNAAVIENRLATSTGEIQRGAWEADRKNTDTWLVRYLYSEDGKKLGFFFSVDFRTLEVVQLKRLDTQSDVEPGLPR